jgi:S-adenosylmethionine decarboxylase
MHGLHLTADLHGCAAPAPVLTDAAALRALCLRSVAGAGLQPVGELFHRFDGGGGVTGVVLLAESHVAVHTWPELDAVTVDVYVCNFGADNSARARSLMDALAAAFAPARAEHHALRRGEAAARTVAARAAAPPRR